MFSSLYTKDSSLMTILLSRWAQDKNIRKTQKQISKSGFDIDNAQLNAVVYTSMTMSVQPYVFVFAMCISPNYKLDDILNLV